MVEIISERTIIIRGKKAKFVAKRLKSGVIAFYRNGVRAITPYEVRLARGVLEGKTVAEATGKAATEFNKRWRSKFYGRKDIDKNLTRFAGPTARDPGAGKYGTTGHEGDKTASVPWAEPPNKADGAFERRRYYALVNIQVRSAIEAGSDIAHDEGAECTPATIALLKDRDNTLTGMTRAEFRKDFETALFQSLDRIGLRLCTGDVQKDVLAIWRHSRR